MSRILFEITKDHLETGLRGVPVGYCVTSSVDPEKGLFYVGRPVSELASWTPDHVIYLLYHGKKGSDSEIKSFSEDLANRASLSEGYLEALKNLPKQGHPMKLFATALLLAEGYEGVKGYKEDCLNIIAKIPEITARVINRHAGWTQENISKPELGYMENFVHMLGLPNKDSRNLFRVLELFNVLHYDHGGGNLSAFTGKTIASGNEDIYGSLAGAMCALAGPLHGKANQDTLDFLSKMMQEIGERPSDEEVEAYIRNCLDRQEKIYGFGHAVLRVEDPRATVQFDLAQELYPDHPRVKIAEQYRRMGHKVLSENKKVSNPNPNVDCISGSLLTAAGFPHSEYYTVLFGLSRSVGIAIQIVYERCIAREGKGVPITRPKFFYRTREGR